MTTRSTRSPRRRTVVALGVVLIILCAFVIRLVDIQVVNAQENIDNAMDHGLSTTTVLAGTRGEIVDDDGTPLAVGTLSYTCQFSPNIVRTLTLHDTHGQEVHVTWDEMSEKIAQITGQSADELRKAVSDALIAHPDPKVPAQYAPLAKNLTTDQYRKITALGADYVACTPKAARTYPNGAVGGNLIGFMNAEGKPGAGLESQYNQCLTPSNGKLTFQNGKDGVIIPGTETETPAVDGGTLKLTIDSDLQWYMQQLAEQATKETGAQYATISVLDVKTHKLKAAAEYPTVDPNNYDAKGSYLYSRIFNSQFEPGSTFKGITAATLIDTGAATPTSTAQVPWVKHFSNGAVVNDAFRHGVSTYTLAGALMDSSNVGASIFSERTTLKTRYQYLKKFGIGDGSAIHFLGETNGIVHPYQDWDNQMRYDTAYGQGLTTTVPELLTAYEALIDGGVKYPIQLVDSCTKADGTEVTPTLPKAERVISEKTSATMREIFENVALQSNSYADMVKIPGYRIGVKTGTGQIAENGHYKSGVYYTTMIGFAPADDPQYLVAVTLDQPTKVRSSTANAPTFVKAMTQVLKTYRVMPATKKPTMLPKFG
ncbi:penicillin-binding protein 2 [Microbacterium horticulturae]|uniref:Penicillin-binding protein 2 n=1 Tax=Microbacterium horticulturae TaxID=3028316 RepID=A0ABY8C362_9MICO|nr:penicillin-binding protein 2 [Microbacterium sp. KACC 23027]WEG10157.1 penicillin-binding protein 2 [Microbacterium sp. KACC 23027]